MPDIQVLEYLPIVVTKDTEWMRTTGSRLRAESGALWVLPADAVLIKPPESITQKEPTNEPTT